jgi:hypothetical protein
MRAPAVVFFHATKKSRRVLVAVIGALLILGGAALPNALAAKPSRSVTAQLSLVSESAGTNPNAPWWCEAEDAYDYRSFSGSLSGSYSTSYRLCDPTIDYYNGIWWNAGGEGLQSDVYVVGQLSDLTITAPDGTAHHAVLMGQSTSKGVTTYHYAACFVPTYFTSTDTGTSPLAGGTWQVTLSGQITKASWITRDDMTDVNFQQTYCPVSEQNLIF